MPWGSLVGLDNPLFQNKWYIYELAQIKQNNEPYAGMFYTGATSTGGKYDKNWDW